MKNRKLYRIVKKTKRLWAEAGKLSDAELQGKTAEFKERLRKGTSTEKIMAEAFAVVCEADRRILGMAPFDCQILGAAALHYGYLTEMNTGEGKTLTATMPLYLNALTGKSSILVTANEYLAIRDAQEMGPVYEFLGLSVCAGVRREGGEKISFQDKKQIYETDVVYTTHSALGFDYLTHHLAKRAEERFLREFYYVIIDEADTVLLDAAQMPLVISASPRVQSNLYGVTDFFVTSLEEERDYIEEDGAVWLSDAGVAYAERFFGIRRFYSRECFEINRHVTLALRAHVLFERGKDYMVAKQGEVSLLDNGTGRILQGMKLRGGQHQALEAKEKVEITQENRAVASVTYQNLFLMFPRMAGMSGTLADARKELKKIYKKKVAVIPPNRPLKRADQKDRYYKHAAAQYEAAVEEILKRHAAGQPVLVITSVIVDTENISRMLTEKQVPHSVLNANNAFWEAEIIREAGRQGAVTVSTGMAGRGTDIRLGEGVRELGGLAVIGIGRMSNVRQERQARGRAGRQGDPGMSRFFVSLEDDVVSLAGEKALEKYVDRDRRISKRKLRRLIDGSQKLGEELAVSQRERSVDYDKVMKRQRSLMYEARDRLLDGEGMEPAAVRELAVQNVGLFIKRTKHITQSDVSRYVLDNLSYSLEEGFPGAGTKSKRRLRKALQGYVDHAWEEKKKKFSSEEELKEYVRLCSLKAMDDAWMEEVDYLQQLQFVVGGRTSAQRNPVFEYHREAYESFQRMQETIRKELTRNVFLGEKSYNDKGEMYIMFP